MADTIALPHWTVADPLPSTGNPEVDRELRLRFQATQENLEGIVAQAAKQLEGAFQQRVPPATVFGTARATAPEGYLPCNGAAVSRSTFADLFTAIGIAYGSGDGSTTFNVPNYNDTRFIRGNSSSGGVGGANTHGHNVSVSVTGTATDSPDLTFNAAPGAPFDPGAIVHNHEHPVTGSGSGSADSQSNIPLYRDLFFIIKT